MSRAAHGIPDALAEAFAAQGAWIVPGAALSGYTTFRLGGPCRYLIECPTPSAAKEVWSGLGKAGIPRLLIGGGSNLLVNDSGIDCAVVRFVQPEASFERDGDVIEIPAGMALDELARQTAEAGLDGVVYCSGIPGTVGGAIAGNAGAFGEQIGDHLVSVTVVTGRGNVEERGPSDLDFSYRRSALQGTEDVVLSATLACTAAEPEDLTTRREEILALRASKHPDWKSVPTAGSFFKNIEPTSRAGRRQASGWFLQEAGAMEMRAGGARTFEKHANIVVADADCRAADVVELTERMAAAVKEKFDLTLEREVKLIGF